VTTLHLDVRAGATAPALLGALVELGASVEAIVQAVSTLGPGDVRLAVTGGRAATQIRVRAPQGSPDVDTWGQLRPRMALLATDGTIADRTVAILDCLFGARATVHRVQPRDVDVDPLGGLDDLAAAVALAAAMEALAPCHVVTGPVGHGTGVLETIEGLITLPGPVVLALLGDRPVTARATTTEVVDPVGAAFLAALAPSTADEPFTGSADGRLGRGQLPGARTNVVIATLTVD
jgi:uncharacterized protein (DUF111 family)